MNRFTKKSIMQSEEFLDDDIQPAYADAPLFGEEQEHLQADDLYGVQTKLLDISVEGVTLEQLAANAKDGLFWEMSDDVKRYLKPTTKTFNRTDVSDKDLDGDLGKVLFLEARIVTDHGNCPKKLSFDIPGLVPSVHTSSGRHNWVVPAECGNRVIGQSIMAPNNVFTKHMYAHNSKCDLKTLKQQIRFDIDPNKQICHMDSKGIGWKVLMDECNKPDCAFADAIEAIYAKNEHIIQNPDAPFSHMAQVPYSVGEVVYESIAAPLLQIEKAYTDLNKWKVRILPADGKPWNDTSGLIRDAVVLGSDHAGAEADAKLCTPFAAGLLLEVKYVVGK